MDKTFSPPGTEALVSLEKPDLEEKVACQVTTPRARETCPACGGDGLDYNGLLELTCPTCGYSQRGGFT